MLFEKFLNKADIIKRIDKLLFARNRMKDRVIAMNKDVTDHLLIDLHVKVAGMFSICLDESTDVTSFLRLALFARFSTGYIMKKELIKLMTLFEKTSGQDVIAESKKEFAELVENMENIVSVTTHRAPNTIGKHARFVKLLK